MHIIEIASLDNGGHHDQITSGSFPVPEGWAIIPDTMEIPETFPFVSLEVDGKYVTKMTPGVVPPEPPEEPSAEEILDIILGEEVGE